MPNEEKDKQAQTVPVPSVPKEAAKRQAPAGREAPLPQPVRRKMPGKKTLVFLAILLILLITAGVVVPVGKIPLLRNMVWMMGYTPEDTEHISLLRALFSWGDKEKLRASISADNMYSVFDRNGGADGYSQGGPRSGLINVRAVNDSLARQGRRGDFLSGQTVDREGPGGKATDVRLSGKESAAATQANLAKQKEVFFGADDPRVPRDKNDGFDTTKNLSKAGNIVGAQKTDWFGAFVDKASLQDSEDLDKMLNREGQSSLTSLADMGYIGNQKAARDLNFAWLVGKAARRSTKPILRKTLASASWNGAELPKKVFDTTGSSGIGIDPDSVVGDIGDIKQKIKEEEECKLITKEGQETLPNVMDAAKGMIGALKNEAPFPGNTCDEAALNAWVGQVGQVESKCQEAKGTYEVIGNKCKIKIANAGSCSAVRLRGMADDQREKCAALIAEAQQKADEEAAANGTVAAPVDPAAIDPSKGSDEIPGTGYDQEEANKNVDRQFNIGLDGKDGTDGDNFFTNPGATLTGGGSGSSEGSSSGGSGGSVQDQLSDLLNSWKKK